MFPSSSCSTSNSSRIYHERQNGLLCGLHALNNVFQCREMYTKAQLDAYCYELTPSYWYNPHCSWGGNYDVNLLIYALQQRNYEVLWYDKRRDPNCLNLSEIFGFIMNVPVQSSFIRYLSWSAKTRHWLALRCIDQVYYNLDSLLEQPLRLGNDGEFVNYLRNELEPSRGVELFLIMTRTNGADEEEAKRRCWLKEPFQAGH